MPINPVPGMGGRPTGMTLAALYNAELTAAEASDILTKADLPYAAAKVWPEVLKDEQAWATDCFMEKQYPSGKRAIVRNPLRFAESGLPAYACGPQLGENTVEIMKGLGYSEDKINELLAAKELRCGL